MVKHDLEHATGLDQAAAAAALFNKSKAHAQAGKDGGIMMLNS